MTHPVRATRPKSLESNKSPLQIARLALQTAQQSLGPYAHRKSRHDFTQAQLFAVLVLRTFFKTDYRGVIDFLADFPSLQQVLGLKKVPHFSTLFYAEKRLLKKRISIPSSVPFWSWLKEEESSEELEPRFLETQEILEITDENGEQWVVLQIPLPR